MVPRTHGLVASPESWACAAPGIQTVNTRRTVVAGGMTPREARGGPGRRGDGKRRDRDFITLLGEHPLLIKSACAKFSALRKAVGAAAVRDDRRPRGWEIAKHARNGVVPGVESVRDFRTSASDQPPGSGASRDIGARAQTTILLACALLVATA
ncbi:MAG: hypothetical protein JNJ54_22390 [Myxococcaceae bacterium]|nr:hypothetical protein [Myxococcaceae bacterium]